MEGFRIGIIGGTGGMGKWFADFARRAGCEVEVSGRSSGKSPEAMAASCDVVCVAVPISATVPLIERVGPRMPEPSLLMDLTSLKVGPVAAMLRSSRCEVVGCHPLFGPRETSAAGQNVVLCPARSQRWLPRIRALFAEAGANVVETTAERHDAAMAVIQGMNHLHTVEMALLLEASGLDLGDLDAFSTPVFREKTEILARVLKNNPRLYAEIICGNPAVPSLLESCRKSLDALCETVRSGDAEWLGRRMESLADKLWPGRRQPR
ncbi:MAG: T-protein [Syntrophaceae bacterium PtaU1.Bin231]|nr:MAG: T-protein [Syntrophaceae bacterium PtaU1.Bin231]HOG17981.1 prephenate dehydrogenase/arogenate dehydrogenase family protein [Syntrophales bacterium]